MVKALNFKLRDQDKKEFELNKQKNDFIVLYFYPKDNTLGCTIEAKGFSKLKKEYDKIDALVVGISGLNEESKHKFCEDNDLKIKLLADTDFIVSKRYKVYKNQTFLGKSYKGISRETFVLDKNKRIIKKYDKIKVLGHAKEVLDFIKSKISAKS